MPYVFQTFTLNQILTAAQMNQVEVNIRDHQHGVSGVADGPAAQADQETGTNLLLFVTPGRQQFHPSALKGWVLATVAGVATVSYNVSSLVDLAAGRVAVLWSTAFSSTNYLLGGTSEASPALGTGHMCNVDGSAAPPTVGRAEFVNRNDAGTIIDPIGRGWNIWAAGDQ